MNASQAKKIPLFDLLTQLGYSPADTRKGGNEVWYCSPFRDEKEPSFKIKVDQNVWYDFGEGIGGNILDFVMRYKNCSFSKALYFLGEKSFTEFRHGTLRKREHTEQRMLEMFNMSAPLITEVKPVYNYALKEYLKGRGITLSIAFQFLKEVHYKIQDKEYFALGFANLSQGWELRNQFFKGCLGKKDASVIDTGSVKVSVFEGFMDFLSYMTLNEYSDIGTDILVLNSTSMKGRGIELIKQKKYEAVNTFFDNDKTGLSTHELFLKELKDIDINSKNSLYMPFKDFNEYLISKNTKQLA